MSNCECGSGKQLISFEWCEDCFYRKSAAELFLEMVEDPGFCTRQDLPCPGVSDNLFLKFMSAQLGSGVFRSNSHIMVAGMLIFYNGSEYELLGGRFKSSSLSEVLARVPLYGSCRFKQRAMGSADIVVRGSSDNIVLVETVDGRSSEICGKVITLRRPVDGDMQITGVFDSGWSFRPTLSSRFHSLPGWPIKFRKSPDGIEAIVTCPAGTVVAHEVVCPSCLHMIDSTLLVPFEVAGQGSEGYGCGCHIYDGLCKVEADND